MARLMPNENAVLYGNETLSDASRQKIAIPLGLIFFRCKRNWRSDNERC